MGVKGLSRLIKLSKNGTRVIRVADLKGKKLPIDTTLWVYQFVIAIRNKGSDLKTSDGRLVSHIRGFWNKIFNLLSMGIIPIFVLDGPPPEIKRGTLKERRKKRDEATRMLEDEEYDSDQQKAQLMKRAYGISDREIRDVVDMLKLMGIPVIQAPGEAELQCASLNIAGKAHGVVTEDWDALPFGTLLMYKEFGKSRGTKKGMTIEVDLKKVLEDLELIHEQFVEICVVLGTDYCPGIKGIGAEAVYYKYKKAGNMERFLAQLEKENKEHKAKLEDENTHLVRTGRTPKQVGLKYVISEEFLSSWEIAKNYYLKAPVYDPEKINTEWSKPNLIGLYSLMVHTFEFEPKSTAEKVQLLETMHQEYQRNLDKKALERLFPSLIGGDFSMLEQSCIGFLQAFQQAYSHSVALQSYVPLCQPVKYEFGTTVKCAS